jgi:uncharacterized membrane protein YqjE
MDIHGTAASGHGGAPPPREPEYGLFASLQNLVATLLAILQTRLELVTTEIEEELHRIAGLLLWAAVTLFFGVVTIVTLGIFVIVIFWDDHRLLAAGLVFVTFVALTFGAWSVVRSRAKARPHLLSATIEELKRDRQALGGRR